MDSQIALGVDNVEVEGFAAMSAQGVSIIDNIDQIDRGYQYIDQRLNALGAVIERL